MLGLDDHGYAVRLDAVNDSIGNLRGHSLLELRSPGDNFNNASQFAGTDDTSVVIRNIADVGDAVKW